MHKGVFLGGQRITLTSWFTVLCTCISCDYALCKCYSEWI